MTNQVIASVPAQPRPEGHGPRSQKLEDYALIGDLRTSAIVGRNGSIDWLCLPNIDSSACFAALLGDQSHGCWWIRPAAHIKATTRRYREGTLILETDFETDRGWVGVIDFMPPRDRGAPQVVRIAEGLRGEVPMQMHFEQRRCRTVPARRLWRGRGRRGRHQCGDGLSGPSKLAARLSPDRTPRDRLAPARRWDLGGPRPTAPLRRVQGDGLARLQFRHAHGRTPRTRRAA